MCTAKHDHPPYKPGDVIVEAAPLVYAILPEASGTHCAGCFTCPFDASALARARGKLFKCRKCLLIGYCSRECQVFDWRNFHKHECDIYSTHGHESIFQAKFTRVYLRLLLVMQKRPEELTRQVQLLGGGRRCFMDQVDHAEEMKANSDFLSSVDEVVSFFVRIGLDLDADKLRQVVFKLHINSFSVYDLEMLRAIGIGNYLEASIFDHSCAPNAATVNNGLRMQLRAIRDISQNEPVLIAYCGVLQNKVARQTQLRSNYYFDCSCTRCVKDDGEDDKVCSQIQLLIPRLEQACSWRDITATYEQLLQLIEVIYGQHHPSLTSRKMDYFLLTAKCDIAPKFAAEQVLRDLSVTHGPEHPLTQSFAHLTGYRISRIQ